MIHDTWWYILLNIFNLYADVDARSMTPSRNTRSYTLRSVPSSPGRSFLSKFWRKQSTIDRLAGAPLLQTGAISFVSPVPSPQSLVGWDGISTQWKLRRQAKQRVSNAAAPTLSVRTVTPVAQRETENENTQEWFSTVRKGQQSRPKKGQRVWGKQMLKRNGIFISNINWQRLHNILGRVKTKVTRIAWRRCLENPWRRWRRECELLAAPDRELASKQQTDTTIGMQLWSFGIIAAPVNPRIIE